MDIKTLLEKSLVKTTYEKTDFGYWKIDLKTKHLSYKDFYHISFDNLNNDDWFIHLQQKNWINWNDFIPAYLQACTFAKIQNVTIKTYY